MDTESVLAELTRQAPPSLHTLGGSFLSLNEQTRSIEMAFDADERMCHSGNIVQGGFITGMVDAAMAYVVIALMGPGVRVSDPGD